MKVLRGDSGSKQHGNRAVDALELAVIALSKEDL